jgi:hypothetical protein
MRHRRKSLLDGDLAQEPDSGQTWEGVRLVDRHN